MSASSGKWRPSGPAPAADDAAGLRAIVDALSEAVIIVTAEGDVAFANAAATRLFAGHDPWPGRPVPANVLGEDGSTVVIEQPDGDVRRLTRASGEVVWRGAAAQMITLMDSSSLRGTEEHLRRTNRLHAALAQTATVISRASDLQEMFDDVCRVAVAFGGFRLAWIARPDPGRQRVEAAASSGVAAAYLENFQLSLDAMAANAGGAIERALRIGVPFVSNDIAADDGMKSRHAVAATHQLASCAAFPLRAGGETVAVFAVYAKTKDVFDTELLNVLHQIAAEISGGLERLAGREARQRAERALAENEARFREIASVSRHVLWMRDAATGDLLYASPAFETVFGCAPDGPMRSLDAWLQLVHPDDRSRIESVLRGGGVAAPGPLSYRIVRAGGPARWIEDEVLPVGDPARPLRLAGNAADVTVQVRADQQIELFRTLVQAAGDAFFLIKPADRFRLIFINEAGARHLGAPAPELLGMSMWEWDPHFSAEACRGLWETLILRRSLQFESAHRRRDGAIVPVEVSISYMKHDDDEFMVGYFRDISERVRTMAELRDSEEKFRVVFDEAADALFIVDTVTGLTIDCNARAIAVLEADHKERVLGFDTWKLLTRRFTQDELAEVTAELTQRGRWTRELDFRSYRGRHFWGALLAQSLRFGGRVFTLVRLSDVTEHRRLVELLSGTERLSRVGGWEFLIAEKRLSWTNEVYRIHGIAEGTPVSFDEMIQHYHPDSRPVIESAMNDGIQSGRAFALELKLITAAQREIWVRVHGTAEVTDGLPWRLYGLFQDITQERLSADTLREREEKLLEQAHLLDEANDAIILYAPDRTVRFWNRGAERLFGWSRQETLDRDALTLHMGNAQQFEEAMRLVIAQGAWSNEIEYRTKSRSTVLVESRWTLIADPSGAPRSILAINTDVTERRRRDAARYRAQRLESIGTLAGGIAHDLNNILAPIVLSSDMLRARFTLPGDIEMVDTIGASARRAADVVRQVLSFSRGVEGTHVPVNFRHLLPEVRNIVSETFPRNIACRVDVPHDLWPIMAEPTQIHQAVLNLCLNARDAMPEGGVIRLKGTNLDVDATFATLAPDARPGTYVRMQVVDTGRGIPREIRDRIFDPFFTTKGPGRGTGLGLSTTLAIVRGHGGFITVESEAGAGTTVSLFFPARPSEARPAVPPAEAEQSRGHGETVLIIDDEIAVLSITRQGLEGAGYHVLTAADGAEGVRIYGEKNAGIALVLTDLNMPVMNGVAAIEAIRAKNPCARVIAMSGVTDAAEFGGGGEPAAGTDFLLKPFTLDVLLASVRAALDRRGTGNVL